MEGNARKSLDISRTDEFLARFNYREPFVLGSFSVDGSRKFVNDDSQLQYLVEYAANDKTDFDLNVGFDETIFKKNDKTEKIDRLLEWIMTNKTKILQLPDQKKYSLNTDFVCFRGLLTNLFTTPYEFKEEWIVCATKFNGTIYLCQFDTKATLKRNAEMTERDILLSSYGYKFEQYMVNKNPKEKPDISLPVNQNEENCVMFRTRLNSHSIISGAEVDCLDSKRVNVKSTNAKAYVELKTSRIITHQRQDFSFKRYKLLKWWAQSFIIGIPRIICGFRNDHGIVCELKDFKTLEIPEQSRGWDPTVCINCCSQILSFIKENVVEDDPRCIYKFESIPGRKVTVMKIQDHDRSKYQFLPEWYISWMDSQVTST